MSLTKDEAVALIEEIGLEILFLSMPEDGDPEKILFVVLLDGRPTPWTGASVVEKYCAALREP